MIDNGDSYKIHTSNVGVHIIQCRDAGNSSCNFYIRASLSKKTAVVSILTLRSYHSCSPRVHYKFREASRVWHLAPHHRAAVSYHRIIITNQIIANERERYGNTISYPAAYKVRASLREEFDRKEADNFRRMPAYINGYLKQTNKLRKIYNIRTKMKMEILQAVSYCGL